MARFSTSNPGDRQSLASSATERDWLEPLQRLWAAAMLVLLVLSWRLWLPDGAFGSADFPRVPLLSVAAPIAAALDWAGIVTVLAGLAIMVISRQPAWQPAAIFVLGLTALLLTNQHRLQPWAYQGWLYGLIFASMTAASARRSIIALTISIYAYSSLGKFDQQFLNTVGPDFVASLMPWVDRGSQAAASRLATASLILPIGELVIAVLLVVPRTRRAAGYGAIAMHAVLVLVLGPLGLRHSAAVIAWNVLLGVQAWLLFVRAAPRAIAPLDSRRPAAGRRRSASEGIAKLVVAAALVLPLLERHGYWDHWLSWSLYSPHTSRVDIQLHETAIDSLPRRAADFVRPDADRDGWYDLAIDRWSLAELAVPVYPQARFQLGVATALAHELDAPEAIRIKIRSVADRRSGQRQETWLIGRKPIEIEARRYWFLPDR